MRDVKEENAFDDGIIVGMLHKGWQNVVKKLKREDLLTGKRGILVGILVVLLSSTVFACRYLPAFTEPNFYAEDGTVFVQTVYKENPVKTLVTPFNGYLVVGQYALAELAVDATGFLGLPFSSTPLMIAIVSCVFLGLTVSLPFIFLRRNIGTWSALALVVLGSLVPLPGSDYAVIGTLGNLKFAFLYWAFVLVLFRYWNAHSPKRVILADTLLLLSVLTYAPAAALLPVAVIPYAKDSLNAIKKKQFRYFLRPEIVSLLVLAALSFLYLVVVYVHGIPKLPGYLDAPYNVLASVKILFRSTLYAVLFFITPILRDSIALLLLAAVCYFGLRDKRSRWIFLFALWAIAVGTVSFVMNRPGVSEYLLKYGKSPDQFFYAQSFVFMFAIVWMIAPYAKKLKNFAMPVVITVLIVFAGLSLWVGGSGGKNDQIYNHLGTIQQNTGKACVSTSGSMVTIQIYPTEIWKWQLPRDRVCR